MSLNAMGSAFLDVIVDVPAVGDRRFTYSFPEETGLPRGSKVRVPFARAMADGFVAGCASVPPDFPVKEIESVYDLGFLPSPLLLRLGEDLAAYYCAPVASLWSCLWPAVAPRKSVARFLAEGFADAARAGKPAAAEAGLPAGGAAREELAWGGEEFRWAIYVEEIGRALAAGRGALFLTPEIRGLGDALERLSREFPDQVCQIHSEMTGLQRRGSWSSLASGERRLAVGTRSAVFAPVPDLGLIVVDGEASSAYKSPESPFYDARHVARARSAGGGKVIFGDSRPSVEMVWSARLSGRTRLREEGSTGDSRDREVVFVDLKDTRPSTDAVSEPLRQELLRAFSATKRAVLFVNRRGESREVSCRDCGKVITCPRCGVPMARHVKEGKMVCHTCGMSQEPPVTCPSCGGHRWRLSGIGIEKVEAELGRKFPGVPVFRLDNDSAKNSSPEAIVREFGNACPSCLLATQMVLGFKLPQGVGVVGALSADTALNLPDYRAAERAYQVLARLGDAVEPGEGFLGAYVIQTRNPDHHAIKGVADAAAFYEKEMQNRRMLGYPPFKRLFKIRFAGKTSERVRDAASEFAGKVPSEGNIRVLGPVPAPKPKVRGQYWWQVALRGDDHEEMAAVCRRILSEMPRSGTVKILIDVDPEDME